jgi:hypothetical protein
MKNRPKLYLVYGQEKGKFYVVIKLMSGSLDKFPQYTDPTLFTQTELDDYDQVIQTVTDFEERHPGTKVFLPQEFLQVPEESESA